MKCKLSHLCDTGRTTHCEDIDCSKAKEILKELEKSQSCQQYKLCPRSSASCFDADYRDSCRLLEYYSYGEDGK